MSLALDSVISGHVKGAATAEIGNALEEVEVVESENGATGTKLDQHRDIRAAAVDAWSLGEAEHRDPFKVQPGKCGVFNEQPVPL